jgi:hypothetical protein
MQAAGEDPGSIRKWLKDERPLLGPAYWSRLTDQADKNAQTWAMLALELREREEKAAAQML